MRCILISVLWLMISLHFSEANWCTKTTTISTKVTKLLTKIVTSRGWFGSTNRKTVTYYVTELIPRIRQHRVCCDRYTLNIINRICEPNCPAGCPQFSGCIKPNICECHDGYRMKGDSCEPICDPTCSVNAFCSSPNVCKCKSGFEYNDSTESCDSNLHEDSTTLDRSFTTLADITTVPEVHLESTEKPTTISITLEPYTTEFSFTEFTSSRTTSESPSTETTRMTSTESSTMSGSTTETPSTETTRVTSTESSFLSVLDISSESSSIETTRITSTEPSTMSRTTSKSPSTLAVPKHGRNVICTYSNNCNFGHCRLVLDHCQCNEGFVKADSSCLLKSGFMPSDDCIEESLCKELSTTTTSTEKMLPSEVSETSTLASTAECPKGSVFSSKSSGCIINSPCEKICHNGICQENGVCECLKGFVYQYDKGCVPNCEQKCINGICIAPGKCKCLDGFDHNPANLFECFFAGKSSEKLKTHGILDFPWIWIVSVILIFVVFGLFIIKKSRSHIYNVGKIEEARHIVHFESKCV